MPVVPVGVEERRTFHNFFIDIKCHLFPLFEKKQQFILVPFIFPLDLLDNILFSFFPKF